MVYIFPECKPLFHIKFHHHQGNIMSVSSSSSWYHDTMITYKRQDRQDKVAAPNASVTLAQGTVNICNDDDDHGDE